MKAIFCGLLALTILSCGTQDESVGDGDADGDIDGDADGDSDGDIDGDTDGDSDGDADGDSGSDGGIDVPLSVMFVDERTGSSTAPAAIATLAFFHPDGTREEHIVGSDGLLTIENVDFSEDETIAVSVDMTPFGWGGIAGFDLEDVQQAIERWGFVPVQLSSMTPGNLRANVSGQLFEMRDENHWITITDTSGRAETYEDVGSAWSMTLLSDLPMSLLVWEWSEDPSAEVSERGTHRLSHGWALVESPPNGFSSTDSLDIYMQESAYNPSRVEGDFSLSPMSFRQQIYNGAFDVGVYGPGNASRIGQPLLIDDVKPVDGNYAFLMEFAPIFHENDVNTEFRMSCRQEQCFSAISIPGYPVDDGRLSLDFLEPVRVSDFVFPVSNTISWNIRQAEASNENLYVRVRMDVGTHMAVQFTLPPGAESLDLPDFPSTLAYDELYGLETIEGSIDLVELGSHLAWQQRYTSTRAAFTAMQFNPNLMLEDDIDFLSPEPERHR